jgi:hypothetical protein
MISTYLASIAVVRLQATQRMSEMNKKINMFKKKQQ